MGLASLNVVFAMVRCMFSLAILVGLDVNLISTGHIPRRLRRKLVFLKKDTPLLAAGSFINILAKAEIFRFERF